MKGWTEYEYKTIWVEQYGSVCSPLLQVKLLNGDNVMWPLALVDSGAQGAMANYDIAEVLGINLELCPEVEVGGVGLTTGRECSITLEVTEFGLKRDISVIFVKGLPYAMLLGQDNLFTDLDVMFETSKKKFHLRKTK